MVEACARLEAAYGLRRGAALRDPGRDAAGGPRPGRHGDGRPAGARGARAAAPGCTSAPTTTRAALGDRRRPAGMDHPVADHAKEVMQVAAAGTGVRSSRRLDQRAAGRRPEQVHAAWALHARLVRRSLERGFYQGWDLHPAQLPTRFLATFVFFRERAGEAAAPAARLPRPAAERRRPRRAGHGAGAGRLPAARAALRRGRPSPRSRR